jgi:hypothetical protein
MKHYGPDFFAQYQGVTADTIAHLLKNDGIKGGEIKGCHDRATFLKELGGKGEVVNETPHPSNGDVARLEYKLYRRKSDGSLDLDIGGNPVLSTGKAKLKTVIKDLGTNSGKWEQLATEAADNAIKAKQLPPSGGAFTSAANDGTSMGMAYRPPQIDTFFPSF